MANKVDIFGLPLEEDANLLASQDLYASPKYRGLSPYQDIARDEAVAKAMESKLQNDVSTNELMDMSKLPYPSSQGQSEEMIDEDKSNELQNMEFINRLMPKIAQQSQVEPPMESNEAMSENIPSQIQESLAIAPKPSVSSGSSNLMDILKNYREQMKDAQKQAGTSTLLAQLNDTFQRFNKEMVGKKYDPAQTEMFMKAAQKPVEDLETLQAGEMKEAQRESQIKALANKMRLDQISQDPNSAASQTARRLAKNFNIDANTYQDLVDQGFTMKDLIEMGEKKDIQRETALDKVRLKALDNEERNDRFLERVQQQLAKPFQSYTKVKTSFNQNKDLIDRIQKGKINPGSADVVLLYNLIKSVDPDSVVREGEIRLGQQGMSVLGKVEAGLNNITRGDLLSQEFREGVKEIAGSMEKYAEKLYKNQIEPRVKLAEKRGIDKNVIYDTIDYGGVLRASQEQGQLDSEEKVKVLSPDGKKGMIPLKNLEKALSKGFKRIE